MQHFRIWTPLSNPPNFFECFAQDTNDALILRLFAEDDRQCELRFSGQVPAYRQIVEECRLSETTRSSVEPSSGRQHFWTVDQSEWLASFSKADLCQYPDLTHYYIETANQCFDVLSDTPPAAIWVTINTQ